MNKVLRPVKAHYREDIQGYIDNIIITTKDDVQHHRNMVKMVLQATRESSLFLKPEKCKFDKQCIKYLGMLLDGDTVQLDPSKVEGLKNWLTALETIKEVQSTLGLLNYNH